MIRVHPDLPRPLQLLGAAAFLALVSCMEDEMSGRVRVGTGSCLILLRRFTPFSDENRPYARVLLPVEIYGERFNV